MLRILMHLQICTRLHTHTHRHRHPTRIQMQGYNVGGGGCQRVGGPRWAEMAEWVKPCHKWHWRRQRWLAQGQWNSKHQTKPNQTKEHFTRDSFALTFLGFIFIFISISIFVFSFLTRFFWQNKITSFKCRPEYVNGPKIMTESAFN